MTVFDPAERQAIRTALIDRAREDPAIAAAALVGSAARDAEDEWSDIDLVLQLAPDTDEATTVREWTGYLSTLSPVADTFDVFAVGVRYRVFLLESSLQIDLSFWPFEQFRATEAPFRLLFGTPATATEPAPPDPDRIIGMGWLYVLHARSAVARGTLWQATIMLDELRDTVVALMCIRNGLSYWHGRGVDRLPDGDLSQLESSRAAHVNRAELDSSRRQLTRLFLEEIRRVDDARAARLQAAFDELLTPLPVPGT
ncbi:nucleotidyltransferase domain-containing protein [Gryllotalpicola ginsengisoli]|uniref:nucleotidyltransferase domain-containing protein n=1 Tax=Gryllotalpicola ginsengisoli TaxID=444608 RepID=UPI0003B5CC28|nr:nucleotidyltransferase domain-containing protein [Gryllotalpicola ginsengisoli]